MALSNAISPSAVARALGIKEVFTNRRKGAFAALPQRVAIVSVPEFSLTYDETTSITKDFDYTPKIIQSAFEAGQLYGLKSPIYLAAKQLLPLNGKGVGNSPVTVYPVNFAATPKPAVATAEFTISGKATEAGSFTLLIEHQKITIAIAIDDTALIVGEALAAEAAKNTDLYMTVTNTPTADASKITLSALWGSSVAQEIQIGATELPAGLTVTTIPTRPGNDTGNYEVVKTLEKIQDVWETIIVNGMHSIDYAVRYSAWNESRWLPQVRKPAVVFSGNINGDAKQATAFSEQYPNDRTNVFATVPSSFSMSVECAAAWAAAVCNLANTNPAHDYGGIELPGILAGGNEQQWDFTEKDYAVKHGSSTSDTKGNKVYISDTVTWYRPDDDPLPAYRFVVDIIKLQNILYNVDIAFTAPAWNGAPLIPNKQASTNPGAKKPKMAVAEAAAIVDSLALNALVSDSESSKENIRAEIDPNNAKRLNLSIPVSLSGNSNIRSITLNWGFFYGNPTVIG